MDIVTFLNYAVAFFTLFTVTVFLLLFLRHRHEYLARPKRSGRTPFVSIVVPAYNEEKYLPECIKTLLAVDYPKDRLEIIIVDDGSKDSTYKIAQSFEGGNVRAFTKDNGGKGAALNFGIAKAKGEFIATMDADSYVTPDTIKELLPYFDEPDVMAVTPTVKVKPGNSWLTEFQRVEYLLILFSRKLLSYIDSVPVTPGPFSIFRASVFDKIGGFDEHNLVEDQEIALRIQANHFKIRSSLTADVYTEPPDNVRDLLKQRIRWQRGGLRNYWHYRFMINPKYGDFGMYFVPLNFASITAFFLVIGLMIYSLLATPSYVRYIWFESVGLSIGLFSFIGAFVIITSTIFLYIAIKSFDNESVKLRYILSFLLFYWFLAIGYNTLTIFKEIRKDKTEW